MMTVKKAMFVFFAALGFSGAFSTTAVARPDDAYCSELISDCLDGNQYACQRWNQVCRR
ncbi:hypothetical protein [Janthinobacterium fluminis]|uniref:Uncharacterized protein n=1 Tax=Janthinobacterium fluminis TaxID=2987524 RepID=A0ABT5K444_9BURK|nr:hypothetical protein [Janthinobacterium fluminis]MDC8759773.1 hypothetical protein [Janthinobacterium fluminis]